MSSPFKPLKTDQATSGDNNGQDRQQLLVKKPENPLNLPKVENVTAFVNPQNPVREVIVKWKKPEIIGSFQYEVNLESDEGSKIQLEDKSKLETCFKELKSDTSYRAYVSITQNGHKSEATSSIAVVTNKETPQNLPKVENVTACLNPQNPVREVIVKWKKPEVIGSFQYMVHLESEKGRKDECVDESQLEKCFKELKSDTKYTAFVSITQNGQKSEATCSNAVFTSKAVRTEGFDINTNGKPTIEICSMISNNDRLESQLIWSLPDIGEEEGNYKFLFVKAWVTEGAGSKEQLVVEENVRARPKVLEIFKNYDFTVQCTYKDLEVSGFVQVPVTQHLSTDIGTPMLNVSWKEQDIIVDWTPAMGAKNHELQIYDAHNKLTRKELGKKKVVKLPMTPTCNYGKVCKFIIEASAATGSGLKTEKSEKNVLIGGDMAVTHVLLKKDPLCPRRKLLASWKVPANIPQGYVLNLYEIRSGRKCLCSTNNTLEKTQLEYRFVELKTSTEYICEVLPQYQNELKPGSPSNLVETEKAITLAFESEEDFGTPEHIDNTEKNDKGNNLVVELKWSPVQVGENYKIIDFSVKVFQPGIIYGESVMYLENNILPKYSSTNIFNKLKKGQKYSASFTTNCMELDNPHKLRPFVKNFSFCTNPSMTSFKPCELKDGMITFIWEPVDGAKKYRLVIKDEFLQEKLCQDEHVTGKDCKVKVKISEKLCIGKSCMAKAYTHANNLVSETEWTPHLIGGMLVPRNLQAVKHRDDPKRSILVTFDAPKRGPADKYKITIVPAFGKKKTIYTNVTTNIIEYLRKGISYKFQVLAKHGDEWSEGAESTPVETDGGDEENPVMNISKSKGSQFFMQSAQFTGNTTNINVHKGDAFGKVRDLTSTAISHEKDDGYSIELGWKVPSFDNKAYDYKVEKYKVEIRRADSSPRTIYLDFQKELHVYKTDVLQLNLGEIYEISVSTIYIDIDGDEEYMSSAAVKKLQTKPCKPDNVKCKIIKNEIGDDALQIEWNGAKGAKRYEVEIFTEYSNSTLPLYKHDVRQDTKWMRTFDCEFGFGTTYHAVITAIGNDSKTNSTKTESDTLGGNFAPKKVCASISDEKVTDANTQVYLSWEQPAEQPESYEITSENAKDIGVISCKETTKLITGLKAGVFYTFKVVAINKVNRKKSGGSFSNRVQTNPTPTQVKDVQTRPGQNASTSINIFWMKVNAEKQNESTKYRVIVTTLDEEMRKEIFVTSESVTVEGLLPGTKYIVTVAGGNTIGFGRHSEKEYFETELGVPKNVELLNNSTTIDTSLILRFSEAAGKPEKYFGGLIKHQNLNRYEDLHYVELQPGYVFNELEANTKYIAIVYAVFKNDRQGKATKSNPMLTAPSKVEICDYGHSIIDKVCSSKELFLTWKSDDGCEEQEIMIKHGDKIENHQVVKNLCTLRYSCLHEASRYSAQIRAKNVIFGPWSDEVMIHLAPAKLQGIKTVLGKNDDRILIQFKRAFDDCLSYFYQAICDGTAEGNPVKAEVEGEENTVSLHFKPAQPAQEYFFKLWAMDAKDVAGESTLSPSVISRPATGEITKVERAEEIPSTDIKIFWKALDRCDEYHVKIKINGEEKYESIVRSTETTSNYRCQIPGSVYSVRVRGIRESVWGSWSEKVLVHLIPAQVELIEKEDNQAPVETIKVEWKELQPKPKGYHVILYQKGEKIDDKKTETTEHKFEKSPNPGSLCYCTVAAFNDAGEGKPVKTLNYRMIWNLPGFLLITADKNDPSRRATITWDRPENVNCFKLKIGNNQTGAVTTTKLEKTTYIFESGLPGNSYYVHLYSGCGAHYSGNCLIETMTMKPSPPTKLNAVAYRPENGMIVTFEDDSAHQKSYEVCAKRVTKENEEYEEVKETTDYEKAVLKNLIPGESYEVSIATIFNKERSKKVALKEYVQTYPEVVQNLKVDEINAAVVFTWDALKFTPDKYILHWRVDNETITEESTRNTIFEIRFLKPACSYNLRVMARNSAGDGEMTQWKTYITKPLPPYNLKVMTNKESPKTSVIVKYEDYPDVNKSYKITALAKENGQDVEKVSVITSGYTTYINGLDPGRSYFFKVQTIFCGKMSEELFYFEN